MALELLQGNLLELTFSDQQPQAILYAPSQLLLANCNAVLSLIFSTNSPSRTTIPGPGL